MTSPIPDTIELYTYYRSSCSARLRIALHHKSIPFTPHYINLIKAAQREPEYTSINPSANVPTLLITSPTSTTKITQSIAGLEYLEEAYPDVAPLLPKDVKQRAVVRTLVGVIASDVQPVTNLKILQKVDALGGNKAEYAKEMMQKGLNAYEAILAEEEAAGRGGKYSVGNEVSLADVCLAPAYWGAMRFGVDFSQTPRVKKVFEEISKLEAFQKGHWNNQPDTPEELRGKDV